MVSRSKRASYHFFSWRQNWKRLERYTSRVNGTFCGVTKLLRQRCHLTEKFPMCSVTGFRFRGHQLGSFVNKI